MIFTDYVTVINHYYDTDTKLDSFNKTVLDKSMWRRTTLKTVSNNEIQVADSVSVTVLYRDGYVSFKEYNELSEEEKKEHFTFNPNNNKDMLVLGIVEEDISDYESIVNVKKKYEYAIIEGLTDNTHRDVLQHWEITAK